MFFFSLSNLLRTYSRASNRFLFVVSTLRNVKRFTKRHSYTCSDECCVPFQFPLKAKNDDD